MKLAWFSPWPPDPSGVAGRSAEYVPLLAARGHGIDVFVDHRRCAVTRASDDGPAAGEVRVQSAHDFIWRQLRGQFDLVVYQIGNSWTHEFIWPYLFRWPGLVVLHETRLHHARAHALLTRKQAAAYREEFAWNHPDVSRDLAELAVAGFRGPYYYDWSMLRAVVDTARLVAVHARSALDIVADAFPTRPIEYIALGEGDTAIDVEAARRGFRQTHALPLNTPIVGVFGGLTPERRVPEVLRAFAAVRSCAPDARLVLVGSRDPALDLDPIVAELGLADVTTLVSGASDQEFDEAIAATDVCVNLRWPTAGETSGPWLRALAAGRATIVTDLAQQRHVPSLDPRTWHRQQPTDDLTRDPDAAAITVAIDILDEAHSLRLALRRLLTDPTLRHQLGGAARRYWEAEHTPERAIDDYERAIARAATLDSPAPPPLRHLTTDGSEHARELLGAFGIGGDVFAKGESVKV